MNNHTLQTMSLKDAKNGGTRATQCWEHLIKTEFDACNIINLLHKKIELLVDMSFESGKWIIMKHESGAVFPVIIPDGQRNSEGWEGLSMSASHMIIKELMGKNPIWKKIFNALDKAVTVENLEITPILVA
jgi:hypothetical protein